MANNMKLFKDWIEIYNKNLKIKVCILQSTLFEGKIKDFKYYENFKNCEIIEQSVNSDYHYFYLNMKNYIKEDK